MGHAMIVHPDDIFRPSQLGLDKYDLKAGTLYTVQDLNICDMILPVDPKYGMEGTHAKVLHLFDMPAVQCPSLTSIQERGQDYSSVDSQLHREANVMGCAASLVLGLLC